MMVPDIARVKHLIRTHLRSSETIASVMIASEGEIFDPADLELWIRESFPRIQSETPFQGVRTVSGELLIEVFARRDMLSEMEQLMREADSIFQPEEQLHEDSMTLLTGNHTYPGMVSEGHWLRTGVRIPFSAW